MNSVKDRSILLEDYARKMIAEEETHLGGSQQDAAQAGRNHAVSHRMTAMKFFSTYERRQEN